jgi:hypothetical protein
MPTENEKLVSFVTSRQKKLETNKENNMDRAQDVADYVAPHLDNIRDTLVKGGQQGKKIFDATAVNAAILATDGIHGYSVSPAFAWFRYTMNRKALNKVVEIREWLDELEFNMYGALNRSNFYEEMWAYIYSGFTMGTSSMAIEEDIAEERIAFENIPYGEFYIADNKFGEVDVHNRKRKVTARKLAQMFGEDVLPPGIKMNLESQPFSEHELLHSIYPRDEFDSRMKDVGNKRFASVWMITEGNTVARVSGFDEFPRHVWRYMKTGKEPYGVSPSTLAMPDIKGLNLKEKTLQGSAQMALDPPLNIPLSLRGQVQWKPRGLNYYKDKQEVVMPATTGINYPVGSDSVERQQAQIKERFHVDTFLLLTQLAGQGDRTAFEVSEMMAEKAAILGAELGPFNKQIDSILDHVFQIETEAGRMPTPPDILLEMAEEDPTIRFDPEYQGPLAQSQQDKFSKDPIQRFFLDVAPVIQFDETVLDNFDLDEGARVLGELNGIPTEMIKTRDSVAREREGRRIAEAEAQQQEEVAAGLEAGKVASEIDKNTGGKLSAQIPAGGSDAVVPA